MPDAITLLIICFSALATIWSYFSYSFQYWSRKGIPALMPSIPLGNLKALPRGIFVGIRTKHFYNELKKAGHRFGGVYFVTQPNLVITDIDLIKDILTRDFQYFVDRGFYHNEKYNHLSGHLFAIDGEKWRTLRYRLTPTFTSGKMKLMSELMQVCVENMVASLHETKECELKDTLARYATDVIGSCAFGINCNSFKDPNAEFRRMGIKIFQTNLFHSVELLMIQAMPNLARKLGISSTARSTKEFFTRVVEETIAYRQNNQIRRNDFLQLLIDIKNDEFGVNQIAAQVFLFFVAGFDTSSTTMTFALYELARNPHMQTRLREEINHVLAESPNGKFNFDNLKQMKYLHQVVMESLRMYPPLPVLNRRCCKQYTIEGTKCTIDVGTPIIIPIYGIHTDPDYYPHPEVFDPERFCDQMIESRHPYLHLPFGEGPRNCIGLRFGLLQSKLGIAEVVRQFRLTVNPRTKPVALNPNTFLLNSVNPIYLTLEKIIATSL